MQATLKDVGKVRPQDPFTEYGPHDWYPVQRCELVPVTQSDVIDCPDWLDYFVTDQINIIERRSRIGNIRVAKWMALDPVEARTDQMEPALGSEIP